MLRWPGEIACVEASLHQTDAQTLKAILGEGDSDTLVARWRGHRDFVIPLARREIDKLPFGLVLMVAGCVFSVIVAQAFVQTPAVLILVIGLIIFLAFVMLARGQAVPVANILLITTAIVPLVSVSSIELAYGLVYTLIAGSARANRRGWLQGRARREDVTHGLEHLDRALQCGYSRLEELRDHPYLEPLRRDPRFAEILAKYASTSPATC